MAVRTIICVTIKRVLGDLRLILVGKVLVARELGLVAREPTEQVWDEGQVETHYFSHFSTQRT